MLHDKHSEELAQLTAEVVSAYISKNVVPQANLAALIGDVHGALRSLGDAAATQAPEVAEEPLKPAVPIKKSVSASELVCLDCGKRFKSLKRHLQTNHGLSPDEYRARWSLPSSYSMVAPNYAEARSSLAKQMGLGQKGSGSSKKAKAK